MDLTLTSDQELIQTTARDVLTSWAPNAGVRVARGVERGYSQRLWKEMTELGWIGLAVDERYGGVGEGFLEACLLLEEAGAALVPSPLLYTLACGALPISRFGTDRQRERWLPAIVAGRPVGYLRAAPHGRWDGGCELVATASGDGYVLDGVAELVPFAAAMEGFVAVARTGDALSCFLLEPGAGFSCEPLPVLGPEPYYRVRLDGARADSVLGSVDGGAEVAAAIDAYGAAASCAEMIGGAAKVLELTVEYAGQREQFGRPIGSFQAVQHHCANMAADVLGARFIGYEAIWRLAGAPGTEVGDAAEVALTVASAKSWVSDAYQRVCALGQQVHGAVGFTAEHDLHLYSEHATAAALRFGDGDFHTDRVADALGLPAT